MLRRKPQCHIRSLCILELYTTIFDDCCEMVFLGYDPLMHVNYWSIRFNVPSAQDSVRQMG